MKFTDGYWMMRKGVRAFYPSHVQQIDRTAKTVTVHAATKAIRHPGDTLDGPMLSITLSAPIEGVIGVRVCHFTGGAVREPRITLNHDGGSPEIAVKDESITFTAGSLSAEIGRTAFHLAFRAGGQPLTASSPRGMAMMQLDGDENWMVENLDLEVGETVYGLGERFAAFVKNGQSIEIWNRDGGTGSDQAYKNVPFYITSRGYGVYVHSARRVEFEVASEKVSRVQFSQSGEALEYYVIHGPEPRQVLDRYTQLTGRPALPPAWSFGLWLSTSFTTDYSEETVTSFIQGMEERDLPLSVFHFDCFWMRPFRWCDFEWNPETFPEPAAMLRRLHERGLKVCVWINPYIAQLSPLFAEARDAGFLVKRPDGSVWQWDMWQAGMGIVDFTNPEACRWFTGKLDALMELGVDCFKTDFGERIPTEVVWHDGSDPEAMHNYYAQLYNRVVFEAIAARRGAGNAVLFARSASAGGQMYPVHWGGDCYSSFPSMAESLRGGLSLGLSGFGFWSHDIGGFEGMPPVDVYKRWLAFGLLSSHSRLHGSSSYRVPWLFDEEAVEVLRSFTRLKCHLMPYLYAMAVQASRIGTPMMRAMFLEFPNDPACRYLDRQYMLGDSLLVAPVFSPDGMVEFYLPEGTWTRLLTSETVHGGRWLRETHGVMSLPLFVRQNTLLAVGARDDRADYDFAAGVTLRLYALQDSAAASAEIPAVDGTPALAITAQRRGSAIEVSADRDGAWTLELPGKSHVRSVSGGSASTLAAGIRVTPEAGAAKLVIQLDA
ncbi:MAG: alpha-xylosidase [Armatimonadetes bacterium]|nr:alpha-xylosidase [Armatimonadota bacterium]MDE2205844.1 alpha-xylosidase [Armatimonadota bacterium]